MSKKNIWKNLKFEKSDTVFTDGRKRVDGYIVGSFTRSEISTKLQELSDELHKKRKHGYIGVSVHYDDPNAWLPAIFTQYGHDVKLFDPADSTTTQEYERINGLCFMIIENDGKEIGSMFSKPKKVN